MNILAIGAHPDDIEVGCAGTLFKHKDKGDYVHMVSTTQGGYGNRPWDMILSEVECVKSKMKVDYTILDNPVGHLDHTWKTVSEIDELIEKHDIDTVYSVWHGDAHQDHQITYDIVLSACRKRAKNLLCFEISSYSNRTNRIFNPQLYVDITEYYERKVEVISCYRSYINEYHLRAVEGLAKHRGVLFQFPYAEAFEIVFMCDMR